MRRQCFSKTDSRRHSLSSQDFVAESYLNRNNVSLKLQLSVVFLIDLWPNQGEQLVAGVGLEPCFTNKHQYSCKQRMTTWAINLF